MSDAEILGPNEPGPRDARDANYGSSQSGGSNNGWTAKRQIPWERIIMTLVFAGVAWVTFWVALVLALAGAVFRLAGAEGGNNLSGYAARAAGYLSETLTYVSGATDAKPFPFND